MAGRTSARTAATRDQASSPLKRSTQSSVANRPRTRSASVELGDDNAGSTAGRAKRSARQASIESVGSNASAASSKQGGSRKHPTRGVVTYPDLSDVVEDPESEQPEDGGEENNAEDNAEEPGINEGSGHGPQSPGGLSQMSGTTAITSASGQTSHTTAELAALDPMMVELLPQLWVSASQILALLAPLNASVPIVESIVRELKVPGSRQAKRLQHQEEKFRLDRENFGTDSYIRNSFILKKLFGSQQVGTGTFRPDAILHAANIATLIKDLLVKESQGQSTQDFLAILDTWFPECFVTEFADNVYIGSSTMLDETFEVALEIRTQYTIAALRYHKAGEVHWDPDHVLMELFYDAPEHRKRKLSYFEDITTNGQIKKLMRAGPANSEDQEAIITERVLEIRNAFRQSDDAAQAGDLVDFEQLDDQFPWSTFLAGVVKWSRSRFDEIEESIRQQGGVDNIVRSLIEAIKNNDSQVELSYDPHPSTATPRQLLPSANIVPGTTGHSLMAKSTIHMLESMKQKSSAPTSNQNQVKATTSSVAATSSSSRSAQSSRSRPSRTRVTGPSEAAEEAQQRFDEFGPLIENNDEEPVDRKTSDYLNEWDAHIRDKNKENRPLPDGQKRQKRYLDAQPNAVKEVDSSQESQQNESNAPGPSKRKHPRVEDDDDSGSEDGGFQADQRNPNPNRRIPAPAARRASPVPVVQPSPKRARIQEDDQSPVTARRRQERTQAARQASARREASDDEFDDDEEERPPPTATQISIVARREAARVKQRSAETQTRTPWSEADSARLIALIEKLGPSWSEIHKAGAFEVDRGQVALKDKARNMKVSYLRANVPLPVNFHKIALGQKEIRSVKAVRPDWEP